jgi:glycosyltransferase involved in cell wall biosynthesis
MKKVLLSAPILTRSGYGEHARFVFQSLKTNPDIDLYIMPLNWGQSNWVYEDTEERLEIDGYIQKAAQSDGNFDISIQVTIPNEWVNAAPINVGVCAGIETDKVSMAWLKKANEMDKVIVVSNHAKDTFTKAKYSLGQFSNSESITYKCETPVEIVHYGVKNVVPTELDLELESDFNFLTVAQLGPRKNLENTVRWFVEEFIDEEVGLVIKGHWMNNSLIDRRKMIQVLQSLLEEYEDRKCSVHLLHGNMSDEEIHGLYVHPKIKAYMTATHGEGFGLPIFEAAYSGLPVVAPSWSGQVDFLSAPVKNEKSGKVKRKALYEKVGYELKTPEKEALWKEVIEPDVKWCYPKEDRFKTALRNVYRSNGLKKKDALLLQEHLLNTFKLEDKLAEFNNIIEEIGDTNETF